jgi:uncharacterized protein YgiM (DUF1202 family)
MLKRSFPGIALLVVSLVLLAAGCASAPPAPAPAPAPAPTAPAPAEETVIGGVRVNATMLNVRAEGSMNGEIVTHARRGEHLAILADQGDWIRVRLGDGTKGWVSAQHVVRDGQSAAARPRRGCQPDSDYAFAKNPIPSFSDRGAHGMVTVEAQVDAKGDVSSTRIVSNTTGDDALAFLTEKEIQEAKFIAPVRNCAAKAFVFTYKRSF